jgi:hypothetical protein
MMPSEGYHDVPFWKKIGNDSSKLAILSGIKEARKWNVKGLFFGIVIIWQDDVGFENQTENGQTDGRLG